MGGERVDVRADDPEFLNCVAIRNDLISHVFSFLANGPWRRQQPDYAESASAKLTTPPREDRFLVTRHNPEPGMLPQVGIDDPRVACVEQAVHAAQCVLAPAVGAGSHSYVRRTSAQRSAPAPIAWPSERSDRAPSGCPSGRCSRLPGLSIQVRRIGLRTVRAVRSCLRQLRELAVQVPFIHRHGHWSTPGAPPLALTCCHAAVNVRAA